mmetsp:Transcript_126170/g.362897  ORF Transcript_126170/g.362897 Transcript_126170/m.362897 type:complete len:317 (+) Transcript_126170:61-1011(+)
MPLRRSRCASLPWGRFRWCQPCRFALAHAVALAVFALPTACAMRLPLGAEPAADNSVGKALLGAACSDEAAASEAAEAWGHKDPAVAQVAFAEFLRHVWERLDSEGVHALSAGDLLLCRGRAHSGVVRRALLSAVRMHRQGFQVGLSLAAYASRWAAIRAASLDSASVAKPSSVLQRPASDMPEHRQDETTDQDGEGGDHVSHEVEEKLKSSPDAAAALEPQGCAICLEESPGVPARSLPCNHRFCAECVERWLEQANTCPICRRNATGDADSHPQERADAVAMSDCRIVGAGLCFVSGMGVVLYAITHVGELLAV